MMHKVLPALLFTALLGSSPPLGSHDNIYTRCLFTEVSGHRYVSDTSSVDARTFYCTNSCGCTKDTRRPFDKGYTLEKIADISAYDMRKKVESFRDMDSIYIDNEFYSAYRKDKVIKRLDETKLMKDEIVLVINKTFQTAQLVRYTGDVLPEPCTTYADSMDLIYQCRKKDIDQHNHCPDKYEFLGEYYCSTAKVYGKKQRDGDGKTPEGMFNILSVVPSGHKTFEGLKAYGPYFMRIYHSIGVHGNGTDTTIIKDWKTDKGYKNPEDLGITKNNFGYGLSHGCIRLDNELVRTLVNNNYLHVGTKVLIYEDLFMTNLLKDVYSGHANKCTRKQTIL